MFLKFRYRLGYESLCRDGSNAAVAARTATVLPAPTSPVVTPIAGWSTHQADTGHRLAVAEIAVQHPRGQVPAERHPGESPM